MENMTKVTIFQFDVYDVLSDSVQRSRRWGTREAIQEIARGMPVDNTATEVDESAVASDIPGLTVRDFNPRPHHGFQTVVS
jgi:hypothetical protein